MLQCSGGTGPVYNAVQCKVWDRVNGGHTDIVA